MKNVIRGLLVAALAALALTGWANVSDTSAGLATKLDPALVAFQEQHPGAATSVIVRTDGSAAEVAQEIDRLGGSDVAELGLIDGLAATLTPQQVARLARDPDVEWVSLNPVMLSSSRDGDEAIDFSKLTTVYPFAAGATTAWQGGVTGEGVTVAVIDSGLTGGKDFKRRVAGDFDLSSVSDGAADENGHGTYVSGIIAGKSDKFIGIAPGARLLNIRVSGRDGSALASDVIAALQWAVDHKDEFDIRVINLSLTSSAVDSYRQDPLDAAVEQAWFHGIVVVTAAGNFGSDPAAADHAPANDPFIITVGAFDDAGTAAPGDDKLASWSSRGVTVDGHAKPDVVAPGVNVVSTLAKKSTFARSNKAAVVEGNYINLSGTSASSAVVAGVVALMIDEDPGLTPDEVKFRLVSSAQTMGDSAAPRVDAAIAAFSQGAGAANSGAEPNDLIDISTGNIAYNSVLWRSVLWRSVLWRSVLWRSVLWRS